MAKQVLDIDKTGSKCSNSNQQYLLTQLITPIFQSQHITNIYYPINLPIMNTLRQLVLLFVLLRSLGCELTSENVSCYALAEQNCSICFASIVGRYMPPQKCSQKVCNLNSQNPANDPHDKCTQHEQVQLLQNECLKKCCAPYLKGISENVNNSSIKSYCSAMSNEYSLNYFFHIVFAFLLIIFLAIAYCQIQKCLKKKRQHRINDFYSHPQLPPLIDFVPIQVWKTDRRNENKRLINENSVCFRCRQNLKNKPVNILSQRNFQTYHDNCWRRQFMRDTRIGITSRKYCCRCYEQFKDCSTPYDDFAVLNACPNCKSQHLRQLLHNYQ